MAIRARLGISRGELAHVCGDSPNWVANCEAAGRRNLPQAVPENARQKKGTGLGLWMSSGRAEEQKRRDGPKCYPSSTSGVHRAGLNPAPLCQLG